MVDFVTMISGAVIKKGVSIAIDAYKNKKAEELKDILIKEIDTGNISRVHEDSLIPTMFRVMQASMNGSARSNLRLLAQIINSLAKDENINPELFPSEFNRYASIIETLSLDEIKILAIMSLIKKTDDREFTQELQNEALNKLDFSVDKTNVVCSALLRTGFVLQSGGERVLGAGKICYNKSIIFDEIIKLADFQDCLKKEGVSI